MYIRKGKVTLKGVLILLYSIHILGGNATGDNGVALKERPIVATVVTCAQVWAPGIYMNVLFFVITKSRLSPHTAAGLLGLVTTEDCTPLSPFISVKETEPYKSQYFLPIIIDVVKSQCHEIFDPFIIKKNPTYCRSLTLCMCSRWLRWHDVNFFHFEK